MTQTITAMYDDQAQAQTALSKLVAAGFPQDVIRLTPGSSTTATRSTGSYDHTRDEGGFWTALKDAFMPEEDRYAYSEGLSRGGTLLTATVDDSRVQAAMDILEENGSVDLDEREATWRKEGWSGYAGSTASEGGSTSTATNANMLGGAQAAGGIPVTGSATASTASGKATSLHSATTTDATAARGTAAGDKEYIPIVEERLNVGKRMTEHGRVRVRSYAIETPVEEQVSLRQEHVEIDRRPVNRAPTPADEALFAEKTIEAVEHSEEAVVSKEARVVEEVGIRKDATQRTETVSDKVRRTEVEVEDERGNVSHTGTSGTDTRKPI